MPMANKPTVITTPKYLNAFADFAMVAFLFLFEK